MSSIRISSSLSVSAVLLSTPSPTTQSWCWSMSLQQVQALPTCRSPFFKLPPSGHPQHIFQRFQSPAFFLPADPLYFGLFLAGGIRGPLSEFISNLAALAVVQILCYHIFLRLILVKFLLLWWHWSCNYHGVKSFTERWQRNTMRNPSSKF